MHDMISQLVLKWARFDDGVPIDVTADFTRLTLDTIALCAMGIRFNSFYQDKPHEFVESLMSTLVESQERSVRPKWLTALMWRANRTWDENKSRLHRIAEDMISRRRARPSARKDLLNSMLNGRDPATGKSLSDKIIVDNMITFLSAGHETTSGLLSFLFALLMLNPEVHTKLQCEIDSVLGPGSLEPRHLGKLPYTKACLREALRLYPPAAGFTLRPKGEVPVIIGNTWVIKPGDACVILLPRMHRDPTIFGSDADEFRPERMLEENFQKLPPNCFKPFGNGERACIGSDFAMQEAIMATAIIVQKFDFELADPEWKMAWKQTSTIKPRNLFMRARLRPHLDSLSLQRDLFQSPGSGSDPAPLQHETSPAGRRNNDNLQPMYIFFGSNTGTCQQLADRLVATAIQRGFTCTVKPLNDAIGELPTTHPVIIISSTHYEGQPPDNAAKFVKWLLDHQGGTFEAVQYAVFGCGNREWQHTYQATPTFLDNRFRELGAKAVADRGLTDAGEGNMFADFDTWQSDHLWPGIAHTYGYQGVTHGLLDTAYAEPLDDSRPNTNSQRSDLPSRMDVEVEEIRALTAGETRPKFWAKLKLSKGTSYDVGDYLHVYPRNDTRDVERLAHALRIQGHDETDPLVSKIASRYELSQPASPKQIELLVQACSSENDKAELSGIGKSSTTTSPTVGPSILELLVSFQRIALPLAQLVTLLPPIRPRLYSISSSPLASPDRCAVTWSLIMRDEAIPGLASHYLAGLQRGDTLSCALRAGHDRFRPPPDLSTPAIMICAGAGIAPFLGFVAHRAEIVRREPALKERLAPMLLYVGCRSSQHTIHSEELRSSGVVDVRYAYSRGEVDAGFAGFVQDRLWAERDDILHLWERGARVYVCGSREMSEGVKEVAKKMYQEVAMQRCGARTEAEVDEWWIEILMDRYSVDVF
ncbi:cytochrome P450 [Xylariaceae sp. FL0804]|nr:cytochrome P450 [Xylariaceae sp. FL0804]